MIKIQFRVERCFGLVEAGLTVILGFALLISCFIAVSVHVFKITKGEFVIHRIISLILCIAITVVTNYAMTLPYDYFQSKVVFRAELLNSMDIGKIALRADGSYSSTYGHIDWACVEQGKYSIVNDTILLDSAIEMYSQTIIPRKFLITSDMLIFPLKDDLTGQEGIPWRIIYKEINWH